MGQIYHKGKYYSGGGENSSLITKINEINTKLEELSAKQAELLEEINSLKTEDVELVQSISSLQEVANNALSKSAVTNATDITTAGYALDARQANPNVSDSLAAKLNNKPNLTGINTYTGMHHFYSPIDYPVDATHFNAAVSVNARTDLNPNSLAALLFHNFGNIQICLYLGTDGNLYCLKQHEPNTVYKVDMTIV